MMLTLGLLLMLMGASILAWGVARLEFPEATIRVSVLAAAAGVAGTTVGSILINASF